MIGMYASRHVLLLWNHCGCISGTFAFVWPQDCLIALLSLFDCARHM